MTLRVERDSARCVVAHLKLKLASCRLQSRHSYSKWLSAPLAEKPGTFLIKETETDNADASDGPLCSKCLESWKRVASVSALLS